MIGNALWARSIRALGMYIDNGIRQRLLTLTLMHSALPYKPLSRRFVTVTFIIQSNRDLIPDFTPWYQEWQDRLRADRLMRWMVNARNTIEKRGDLEAHSYVSAEISASYLREGPAIQVPAELWDAPLELQRRIPDNDLGEHIRNNGTLRIKRRWIENTLPDFELLDAVAIAYGRLSELVDDAHRQAGLSIPETINESTGRVYPKNFRNGRLPCMIMHEEARARNIDLRDGRPVDIVVETVHFDPDAAEAHVKRIGIAPAATFPSGGDPRALINSLFMTVRRLFESDGYHDTICFLYREGAPVGIVQLNPDNQGEKYLLMRRLAKEVADRGADIVAIVGEAWSAPAEEGKRYMRAADSTKREEVLLATLASATSDPIQLHARIIREGSAAKLGETVTTEGGRHYAFAPLYEIWGRAIPPDWVHQSTLSDGGEERS